MWSLYTYSYCSNSYFISLLRARQRCASAPVNSYDVRRELVKSKRSLYHIQRLCHMPLNYIQGFFFLHQICYCYYCSMCFCYVNVTCITCTCRFKIIYETADIHWYVDMHVDCISSYIKYVSQVLHNVHEFYHLALTHVKLLTINYIFISLNWYMYF